MKKIICINCGSNNIDFESKYYECRHCHTKYRLPEEIQSKIEIEERAEPFKYKYIFLGFLLISIVLFSLYFSRDKGEMKQSSLTQKKYNSYQPITNTPVMINNTNAHIGTQSIVINNYNIEKQAPLAQKHTSMNYWNIFIKEREQKIDALIGTQLNSYLLTIGGKFMELDSQGREIWSQDFVKPYNITRVRSLSLGERYLFSYGSDKGQGTTVFFDANKEIRLKLPIFFHSMVTTKKGFIGVTRDAIKHVNRQGEVLWSKSLNRVSPTYNVYNEVVRLEDNTFVELGIDKKNILWISKYQEKGTLLWQHKTSTYQTFIKNVIATSDGGFIFSAGRHTKVFKYNSDGELEWSSSKSKYREAKAYHIIEAEDGYIHLNRLSNGFVVSKLDYDGNILWEQKYQGKKRILLNGITKAFDGGYLLALGNELGYSWLVKMSEQGEIRCDFDDERYRFNPNTKLLYSSQVLRKDKIVTTFRKTGGNCNRVRLSSNEKYL